MKIMKLLTLVFAIYAVPIVTMEQNKTDKLKRFYHRRTNSTLVERHNDLVLNINHFDGSEDQLEQLKMKLSLVDEEVDRRLKEDDIFEKSVTGENYNKEKMYE